MKPSQLASQLRRIAAGIDRSKNPDRNLVARDLKKVLVAIDKIATGNSIVVPFTGFVPGYIMGEWGFEDSIRSMVEEEGNFKVGEIDIKQYPTEKMSGTIEIMMDPDEAKWQALLEENEKYEFEDGYSASVRFKLT